MRLRLLDVNRHVEMLVDAASAADQYGGEWASTMGVALAAATGWFVDRGSTSSELDNGIITK